MKKIIFAILILTALCSCATTGSKISSWGTDGKYVGPVVRGQNGEKMVIPNGGLPGIKAIMGIFKR